MLFIIENLDMDVERRGRDKFHYIEKERHQPEWQRRRNQSRRAKSCMQEDF